MIFYCKPFRFVSFGLVSVMVSRCYRAIIVVQKPIHQSVYKCECGVDKTTQFTAYSFYSMYDATFNLMEGNSILYPTTYIYNTIYVYIWYDIFLAMSLTYTRGSLFNWILQSIVSVLLLLLLLAAVVSFCSRFVGGWNSHREQKH